MLLLVLDSTYLFDRINIGVIYLEQNGTLRDVFVPQ
jgi:hypothetical protein